MMVTRIKEKCLYIFNFTNVPIIKNPYPTSMKTIAFSYGTHKRVFGLNGIEQVDLVRLV